MRIEGSNARGRALRSLVAAGVACGIVVTASLDARATSASTDSSFGTGGFGIFDVRPDQIAMGEQVVALEQDGDEWRIARTAANGILLDTGFGTAGVAGPTAAMLAHDDVGDFVPQAVLQDPDGAVLLAGRTDIPDDNSLLSFARFTSAGVRDDDFGDEGYLITTIAAPGASQQAVLDDDGGVIVITGLATKQLRRWDADGNLDTDFGEEGVFETDAFGECDLEGVQRSSTGAILLAGLCIDDAAVIVRVTADGALDDNWGDEGVVAVPALTAEAQFVTGLAATPDGGALLLRGVQTGAADALRERTVVTRYLSIGTLDPDFGAAGVLDTNFGAHFARMNAARFDEQGGILLAGFSGPDVTNRGFSVARVDAVTAARDCGWNPHGIWRADIGAQSNATALAFDTQDRVIAAGLTANDPFDPDDPFEASADLAVVRYLALDEAPAPCPVDAGAPTGAGIDAPSAKVNLSSSINVEWSADDESGIDHHDMQRVVRPWNASSGAWSDWHVETADTSKTMTAGTRGNTYCFRTRATDVFDQTSAFSPPRCTAIPLLSSSFTRSGSWTKVSSSDAYGGFFHRTSTKGATATRADVRGERFTLIATKCANCGTVSAAWNGKVIKTINLKGTTTKRKQQFPIATFSSSQTGTLKLTVTSPTGRTVSIEGLAAYRD